MHLGVIIVQIAKQNFLLIGQSFAILLSNSSLWCCFFNEWERKIVNLQPSIRSGAFISSWPSMRILQNIHGQQKKSKWKMNNRCYIPLRSLEKSPEDCNVADEWISINVQHHVDGWISTIKWESYLVGQNNIDTIINALHWNGVPNQLTW
jgi:hypothetical protein